MSYLQLIKREPRPLIFSTSSAFFSSYGQSHLLAIFSVYIMAQLKISNTEYGLLYSSATLASAAALPFVGPLIDKLDLRRYSLYVGKGLLIGIALLLLLKNIYLGFLALFILRLCGQGLCSHVNGVSIARYFTHDRGKALSLSSIGYPLAEGIFTPVVALLILTFQYEKTLIILIALLLFIYFPITQWITKNNPTFNQPQTETFDLTHTTSKIWTTKDVLKDLKFYLLIPHSLFPPFSLTGFLVYQAAFCEYKHWSINALAVALSAFAIGRVLTSFIAGPIIDKVGAIRMFPYYQIPLSLGFLAYLTIDNGFGAYAAMVLFGVTVGASGPIKSSMWAELYGVQHLGAIKSLIATLVVISTALSSFLFGWLVDKHYELGIAQSMFIISITTAIFAYFACRKGYQ